LQTESNHNYDVVFTEEFDNCLIHIQDFFAEQGDETLNWWYLREEKLINHLDQLLSRYPYIGQLIERGNFKGLRRTVYGKGSHVMLNYVIFYEVIEETKTVIVINILPSRSKGISVK
jgi:hypothetical protein